MLPKKIEKESPIQTHACARAHAHTHTHTHTQTHTLTHMHAHAHTHTHTHTHTNMRIQMRTLKGLFIFNLVTKHKNSRITWHMMTYATKTCIIEIKKLEKHTKPVQINVKAHYALSDMSIKWTELWPPVPIFSSPFSLFYPQQLFKHQSYFLHWLRSFSLWTQSEGNLFTKEWKKRKIVHKQPQNEQTPCITCINR